MGTYCEFVQMLFNDDEILPDLLSGDVRAGLFTLIKLVSEGWNERIAVEVFRDRS